MLTYFRMEAIAFFASTFFENLVVSFSDVLWPTVEQEAAYLPVGALALMRRCSILVARWEERKQGLDAQVVTS